MRLSVKLLLTAIFVLAFFGFSMLLSFFRGGSFCIGTPTDSNGDGIYENCVVTD